MNNFKIGDKVRRISDNYAHMTIGDVGTVFDTIDNSMGIKEYNSCGRHDMKNFELIKKRKSVKVKPDNMIRYMAYGSGCDNKSELLMNEKILKESLKNLVKDSIWTGRIIGYKLVPLFETEKKIVFKTFKFTKIKPRRKNHGNKK